jgi:hypothetical protein
VEIDVAALHDAVLEFGGLQNVMGNKRCWARIADSINIPSNVAGRADKLDEFYCKYVLPYATLSDGERDALFREVEAEYVEKLEAKKLASNKVGSEEEAEKQKGDGQEDEDESDSEDEDMECVTKVRV